MSFYLALRAEMLKTKRTPAIWISIIGALLIPGSLFLVYLIRTETILEYLQTPWETHIAMGWNSAGFLFFPMFTILICALVPQIEFRNNTWKQVYSLPQSVTQIFFSKFLLIQLIMLFCYTLFSLCMIFFPMLNTIIDNRFGFFRIPIPLNFLIPLISKLYISFLGISALQFWLSLRFKSFVAPVGIGIVLFIMSRFLIDVKWQYANIVPFANPAGTLLFINDNPYGPIMQTEQWWSVGYFVLFGLIGYFDLRFRREKG